VTDGLYGLLGLLFIAGLFVAYGLERRKKRLERLPRPAATAPGTEPPAEAPAPPSGIGTAPRYADLGCLPVVPSFLLLLVVTHRDDFWGILWQVVFFALVAIATWAALRPSEFDAASRWDPELTLRGHRIRIGVGFVVLPLLGWVLAVPLRWDPGFLVPALPWALMLAYAYVASAFPRQRR
jgi:cbb3-type cytochrome oxidase subunit 3